MGRRKSILYCYDDNIGSFHYGPSHPMKPHRVRMTHDLIRCYKLLGRLELITPLRPSVEDLTRFHANDYVDFLRSSAQSRLEASTAPRPFLFFSPSSAAGSNPLRSRVEGAADLAAASAPPEGLSSTPARNYAAPASQGALRGFASSAASAACDPRLPTVSARGDSLRAPQIDLGLGGGWSRGAAQGGEKPAALKGLGEGAGAVGGAPSAASSPTDEETGTGGVARSVGLVAGGVEGLLSSAAFEDEVASPPVALPSSFADQMLRFNVGEDCPVFDGLWEYCQTYSGGSIEGARRVVRGEYEWAINWAGGLHHGKKHEASGFCYINDCVLAALEFLRFKHRVLYVDVDIHHGDGVEEAFYTSPRVLCCSFHKYGDFFPGTGALDDIGIDEGLGYSVNVPLSDGVDDAMYTLIFRRVMDMVMETYQPEAVVLQSGADSLSGDRLGCFNLSIGGHSEAVRYFRSKNVPAVVLGGGGYTLRNVPRCWASETSHILGLELNPQIPEESEYVGYYGPDSLLHVRTSNMENRNEESYVQHIVEKISQTLKDHVHPVSAQISANAFLDDPCEEKSEQWRALLAEQEEEASLEANGDDEEPDTAGFFEEVSNRNRG